MKEVQFNIHKTPRPHIINLLYFVIFLWVLCNSIVFIHISILLSEVVLTPLSTADVQDSLTDRNDGQLVIKVDLFTSFIYKYDYK